MATPAPSPGALRVQAPSWPQAANLLPPRVRFGWDGTSALWAREGAGWAKHPLHQIQQPGREQGGLSAPSPEPAARAQALSPPALRLGGPRARLHCAEGAG